MVTLILDRFISGVKQSKFAFFILFFILFPTQKPLGVSQEQKLQSNGEGRVLLHSHTRNRKEKHTKQKKQKTNGKEKHNKQTQTKKQTKK
jgi:hypothetical protein